MPPGTPIEALAGCAYDGEERDCHRFAVSTTADGTKIALLWAESGDGRALLIPRDTVLPLVETMKQAMNDRGALVLADAAINELPGIDDSQRQPPPPSHPA